MAKKSAFLIDRESEQEFSLPKFVLFDKDG
jgi:hypothetical protein